MASVLCSLTGRPMKLAPQKSPAYLELIRKREILLYLFPWVMFSIINFAEAPILEGVFGTEFFAFVQLVESVFVGFVAIVGGFIADIAGRKRVVIAGFVMLGIEYATLSAFSNSASCFVFVFNSRRHNMGIAGFSLLHSHLGRPRRTLRKREILYFGRTPLSSCDTSYHTNQTLRQ